MAFSISTQPQLINKLYSPNIYEVTETTKTVTSFLIDIYFTGETTPSTSIRKIPINNSSRFDLSATLQSYIESFVEENIILTVTYEQIMPYYQIVATAFYDDDTEDSVTGNTRYLINGCEQSYSTFDLIDYIGNNTNTKLLMPHVDVPRYVTLDNNYLSFQAIEYSGNRIDTYRLTVYYKDGTSNGITLSISGYDTIHKIRYYNISPVILNFLSGFDIIDETTDYYTIDSTSQFGDKITVYITPVDDRFEQYDMIWTDEEFGVNESFIFQLNSEKSYDIDKEQYKTINTNDFSKYSKLYNIGVEENIEVVSDFVCHNTSRRIKNLWYSPAVIHHNIGDDLQRNIIVNDNSITQIKRVGSETNHTLSFRYTDEYIIQKK